MPDRRDYLRSVSALGLATVLAGCGGGDDGNGGDGNGGDGNGGGGDGGGGDGGGGDGGNDGGDGGDDGTATATDEPAETTEAGDGEETHGEEVTPTGDGESAEEAYPDYNWGKLDGESAEEATTITMVNFEYDPIIARVPAGEEVTFPNEDGSPHTVTLPALDIDENVDGGGEVALTFDEPGEYGMVCRFHPPGMLGRLIVE